MNYAKIQNKIITAYCKGERILFAKADDYYFVGIGQGCVQLFAIPKVNMLLDIKSFGYYTQVLEKFYKLSQVGEPITEGKPEFYKSTLLYAFKTALSEEYQYYDSKLMKDFGKFEELKIYLGKDICYIFNQDNIFLGIQLAVRR